MTEDRPFRLHPRRPRQGQDESRAWSKAFQGVMRIVRMTSRRSAAASATGSRAQGSRPVVRQRCAVRITYSSNRVRGQWAAHGRYLVRESAAGLGGSESGFSGREDSVPLAKRLAEWQRSGDARLFKLIVSPEFGERMDLREHARGLMLRVEQDLARELEWVAVAHHNTDHPHVHIALRGMAGGEPLRLERGYIQHGIRRHAEELCTAQLGFRTQADALEAERREIGQARWTTLDARIQRSATTLPNGDLQLRPPAPIAPGAGARAHHLTARLRTLARMGLARETPDGAWQVESGFQAALRTMQQLQDRQRMVFAHAALLSDPRLPIQYTPAREIGHLEGRVLGHSIDESGQAHMILEATDAKVHVIPHTPAVEAARHRGQLAPNSFVRLRGGAAGGRPELHVQDLGQDEAFMERVASRVSKAATGPTAEPAWGGWLGRFLRPRETHEQEGNRVPRTLRR